MRKTDLFNDHPRAAAYAADLGATVFGATATVIVFTAVVEFYRPGTAASYLPPQGLFLAALASGLVSLAAPRRGARGLLSRLSFGALGALVAFVAATAGWRYFGPLDGARLPLAAAATFIVAITFVAMGRVAETPDDV